MGGLVYLVAIGVGVVLGIAITGGMRIGNRQARSGHYMRMPGTHRKVIPARPLLDTGGTTWTTASQLEDTILPGQIRPVRRAR